MINAKEEVDRTTINLPMAQEERTVILREKYCTRLDVGSLCIKNIGNNKSDEVVQIYGTAPQSKVKKPLFIKMSD